MDPSLYASMGKMPSLPFPHPEKFGLPPPIPPYYPPVLHPTVMYPNMMVPPMTSHPYAPQIVAAAPPTKSAHATSIAKAPSSTQVIPPPALPTNTTVYIGNISSIIKDETIYELLEICGKILKWNRAADPSTGKLTAFGFCTYDDPLGAHRAIKLLDNTSLDGKALRVNCQEKVRNAIFQWRNDQIFSYQKENPSLTLQASEAILDEKDTEIRTTIDKFIQSKEKEWKGPDPPDASKTTVSSHTETHKKKHETKENVSNSTHSGSNLHLHRPSYISEAYWPHWREREYQQMLDQKENEMLREYNKLLREWERDEEYYEKEMNKEKKKMAANLSASKKQKLIDLDKQGIWYDESLHRRHRRERKKMMQQEKINDEKDYEEEQNQILLSIKLEQKRIEEETLRELQSAQEKKLAEEASKWNVSLEIAEKPASTDIMSSSQCKLELKTINPTKSVTPKIENPLPVNKLFSGEEDEGGLFTRKHRPLTKLEEHRDITNQEVHQQNRNKVLESSKKILSMIPTDTKELFEFPIKWNIIKQKNVIELKLRPWVQKKVIEFIGGDETLLTGVIDFIIQRVNEEPLAKDLYIELEKFLDNEGEGFVKNIWRMLIFEQLRIDST